MNVITFLKIKNGLIQDYLNDDTLFLVPENLLQEVERKKLNCGSQVSDSKCCPYCSIFLKRIDINTGTGRIKYSCEGCPMFETNDCGDPDSTYHQVKEKIDDMGDYNIVGIDEIPGVSQLVRLYNDELARGE